MALDLQSGRSYWLLKNPDLPDYPELDEDRDTRVLVIGAGVTGALAAALLVEAGIEVMVLDRRSLGCGSTGASTALLSYEPDLSLTRLSALRGWDVAARSYRASRDANIEIGRLVARLGNACDYEPASSVHFARTREAEKELRDEHRLRQKAGLPCDYLDARELSRRFGMRGEAAILSDEAGQLDPVRFTRGLLDYVVAHAGTCLRATVTSIRQETDGHHVETAEGARIRAEHVVVATGYEAQLMFEQPGVELVSTYAIAADVVDGLPAALRTLIMWDTDDPYHYVRIADGRFLVGGEDVPFVDEAARDGLMGEKAVKLRRYLETVLPQIHTEIATTWCGTFARSPDGLPFIGERPDTPGVSFSLAYGGNGITFGMLGAIHVRNLLTDQRDDPTLFALDRHTALR